MDREKPKTTVAPPNTATAASILTPTLCLSGRAEKKAAVSVAPTAGAFQAAAANADWAKAAGFNLLLTSQPGKESWPITGATFILMYKTQDKPENAKAVLNFLDWSYKNGGKMAEELDYVPMPTKVVDMVESVWKTTIKAHDGKPVWTGSAGM